MSPQTQRLQSGRLKATPSSWWDNPFIGVQFYSHCLLCGFFFFWGDVNKCPVTPIEHRSQTEETTLLVSPAVGDPASLLGLTSRSEFVRSSFRVTQRQLQPQNAHTSGVKPHKCCVPGAPCTTCQPFNQQGSVSSVCTAHRTRGLDCD